MSRTIVCYRAQQLEARQVLTAMRESGTTGQAPRRGFEGWKGCRAMFNDRTAFPVVGRERQRSQFRPRNTSPWSCSPPS